jgi:hypothetical protein
VLVDCDFYTRFNEHRRSFRQNNTSRYALHILCQQHTYGHIHDVTESLQTQKKGPHLNTIERFYIYKEAPKDNQLNDENTVPITEFSKPFLETSELNLNTPPPTALTPYPTLHPPIRGYYLLATLSTTPNTTV